MTDNSFSNLTFKDIEAMIKSMNWTEKKLLLFAREQGWITHCFDCEESLSSLGREPYQHTCRCYCEVCNPL